MCRWDWDLGVWKLRSHLFNFIQQSWVRPVLCWLNRLLKNRVDSRSRVIVVDWKRREADQVHVANAWVYFSWSRTDWNPRSQLPSHIVRWLHARDRRYVCKITGPIDPWVYCHAISTVGCVVRMRGFDNSVVQHLGRCLDRCTRLSHCKIVLEVRAVSWCFLWSLEELQSWASRSCYAAVVCTDVSSLVGDDLRKELLLSYACIFGLHTQVA